MSPRILTPAAPLIRLLTPTQDLVFAQASQRHSVGEVQGFLGAVRSAASSLGSLARSASLASASPGIPCDRWTGVFKDKRSAAGTMNTVVKIEPLSLDSIAFQEASLDIWDKKYRLTAKDGEPIDKTMDDTYKRVARALADVETVELREAWYERFLWALRRGAIPAGRVTSNAGALEHKPATSTINCTVSGTIRDSMDDILRKVHEAGLTLKAGCGIGYEHSTLRPRGAYVSGAGAYTSGPLSFMDIYDKMCFTVSSAGGRRGAQMGTFDVGHPDAMEFIRAKRENGRLRQFNLSLLITDEFMAAVRESREWKLAFPIPRAEIEAEGTDLTDS